jgi:TonB family protein
MRRTTLVTVSIAGHFAVALGLYAAGIWKIERLESDHRLAGIGVMTPTQAAGGSPADLPAPKFVKKEQRKVIKEPHQPALMRDDVVAVSTSTNTKGNGEGTGTGENKGPDVGGIPGGVTCDALDCTGVQAPQPPEPPKPVKTVINVPPTILNALRTYGDTQIHPSRNTQNQMLTDGKTKVVGTVKVCIQATGAIGSVTLLSSTKYPEYDQLLLEGAKRWQYRPYMIDGTAQPACSAVSFVYSIK